MKLRRFLSLLLSFVVIFSVVFSVSAYAYDVNGYDVKTKYAFGDYGPFVYTDFTTTITSSYTQEFLTIVVDIPLSEPINEDGIFDLSIGLDFGSCSSVSGLYRLQDSNGAQISSGSVEVENKTIILNDLVAESKVYSVQISLLIHNPVWNDQTIEDLEPTFDVFRFLGDNYSFVSGMTWAVFCDSSYNLNKNFYYDDNGVYYISSSKRLQVSGSNYYDGSNPYASYVKPSDFIIPFNAYSGGGNDDFGITDGPSASFEEPSSSSYNVSLSSTVSYTYNFTITFVNFNIIDAGNEYPGIIGWIKSVFNSIKNLPSKIANSLESFFNTLGSEITSLGSSLLYGIKNLFVPTQDDITLFKDKFEYLLSDRFGAVYDSTEIVDDFANAFTTQSQSAMIDSDGADGFITFPSVSITLAGVDFTFGGWDVDLVPDKFEPMVDVLKLITNVTCTFIFVNAMRRKLEVILQ